MFSTDKKHVQEPVLKKYSGVIIPTRFCKVYYKRMFRSSQICMSGPGGACKVGILYYVYILDI